MQDNLVKQAQEFRNIELWSGFTGITLGKIRFFLGSTFDKISDTFEWIKGKFEGFHDKAQSIPPSPGFGWRKTLITILVKGIKIVFRELLTLFYQMFAECISGIFQKVVNQFTQDISEKLTEELEALHKKFDKYEAHFGTRSSQAVCGTHLS